MSRRRLDWPGDKFMESGSNLVESSLKSRQFGTLPSGESVEAWTLCGSGGVELEAITYGGIVTRLLVPDREGHPADVVLGFATLETYLAGHPYFGAMIGRVAGRIADAQFFLDGKKYNLCCNDSPNHLHGGLRGFDKKLWDATAVERQDGAPSLRLSVCSPDGEEGYPGTVQVDVTYTVTNDNVFLIEASATTDRSTPFVPTHHSYFNLDGEGANSVDEHELEVHADEFIPTSPQMTPLGRLESVAGSSCDFRFPRRLGTAIPILFQRHGDLYRLRHFEHDSDNDSLVTAARLVHPGSGRVLEVATTAPYLQMYTGAKLDGSLVGKSGVRYGPHAGLCLECQRYSNGVNAAEMGNTILHPGVRFFECTAYAFSTTARKEPA